ncbi:MAG: mechanosensitive ion channel domain-containing protein [Planctomycetota bacterium]|jgi:potassium efflux system protein
MSPLRQFLRHCLLRAGICLTMTVAAGAQQDPELKTPILGTRLTVEAVEARLQKLRDAKGLEDPLKTRLQSTYADVVAALQAATKAADNLAASEALKQGATAQRATLKAQLQAVAEKPDDNAWTGKSSDQLKVAVQEARTAQGEAARRRQQLEEDVRGLAERQRILPGEIVAAEQRLKQADGQLQVARAQKDDPLVAAAQHTLAAAKALQARRELDALKAELEGAALAGELRGLRLDLARKHERQALDLLQAVESFLQKRQASEAREAARVARRQALLTENTVLATAAEDTANYAGRWGPLSKKLAQATQDLRKITQEKERIERSLKDSQLRIEQVGLTEVVGYTLRRQKGQLPSVSSYRKQRRGWSNETAAVYAQRAEIDELRVADKDDFVGQVLLQSAALSEERRRELEAEARQIFAARRDSLDKLLGVINEYAQKLGQLDAQSQLLLRVTREFSAFLEEKILWIRSGPALWSLDWPDAFRQSWTALPAWPSVLEATRAGMSVAGIWILLAVLSAAVLLALRRPLNRWLKEFGMAAKKRGARTLAPTSKALAITLALTLPAPLLLVAAWALCRGAEVVGVWGSDASRAFLGTALFLLVTEFLRKLGRPHGLADGHFSWSPDSARLLRRVTWWLAFVGAPLLWLVLLCGDAKAPAVGRSIFLVASLLGAIALAKLFRPRRGLLGPTSGVASQSVFRGDRTVVFLVATLAPLALATLSASGLHYTALQLGGRVLVTVALLLGLLVLSALITRWRLVTRRNLVMEQRRQQLLAQKQAAEEGTEAGPAQETPEDQLDVVEVDAQTRKLIWSLLLVVGLLLLVAIWAGVFPFLSLREVQLWQVGTGDDTEWITLADVILAVIALLMTVVAGSNLPGFLKLTLFRGMQPGNQYAAATLVQYGIVVVGIITTFALIGIGWSKVQWLVAAVSLGLGFGLQEIFANFVSGVILLFEQPVRVGDFVTVGDVRGEVTRIRIRATTVRNLDRQELIVPNRELITGKVVNWTLSDTINRITVSVGIAYGSNVDLARETLLRVAHENPYVVDKPKPKAIFRQFGDSSLVFELRIFIRSLDDWAKAMDSIHSDIDRAFREAKIEIAFPQRDLHVRSVDRPLPFAVCDRERDAGNEAGRAPR